MVLEEEEDMIVAIDGPAGVGKSSIARMVASRAGMKYINSGNLYRAITYVVLSRYPEGPPEDPGSIIEIARSCSFRLTDDRLLVNGEDIDDELHTDQVDAWVAQISAIIPVRRVVNDQLRELAYRNDSVVEGRDITTVVFPDAEVKIFLDASVETRAKRRYHQGTSNLTFQEIADRIRARDQIDRSKKEGSMKIASDAFYLDTSDLTIDQVCEKVLDKIHKMVQ